MNYTTFCDYLWGNIFLGHRYFADQLNKMQKELIGIDTSVLMSQLTDRTIRNCIYSFPENNPQHHKQSSAP